MRTGQLGAPTQIRRLPGRSAQPEVQMARKQPGQINGVGVGRARFRGTAPTDARPPPAATRFARLCSPAGQPERPSGVAEQHAAVAICLVPNAGALVRTLSR
jgi:hypothetical protein